MRAAPYWGSPFSLICSRAMTQRKAMFLLGMLALVALAWWLADQRIALCYWADEACKIRTTATRDNALVIGLGLTLVSYVIAWPARRAIFNRRQSASSERRPLLEQ